MAADEEEDDMERALKLAHMDMYNMRLLEREKRKRSVCVCVCVCLSVCLPSMTISFHRIAKQQNLIAGKQRQSGKKWCWPLYL